MSFALTQYRSVHAETSSPAQIVAELHRGALRFLRQALAEPARARRGPSLSRAHAIVSELQCTLDFARAPELASQLDRLYDFVLRSITEAAGRGEERPVWDAIRVVETLESAWTHLAGSGS